MPTPLRLLDLLRPFFLLGYSPAKDPLGVLHVLGLKTLRSAVDDRGVVYTGVAQLVDGEAPAVSQAVAVRWRDIEFPFRLTVVREGAEFVKDDLDAILQAAGATPSAGLDEVRALQALFDDFAMPTDAGPIPSDYPGFRFRLELMIRNGSLSLGKLLVPAERKDDGRIGPKKIEAGEHSDVRIVLPPFAFRYEQGQEPGGEVSFRWTSLGADGFDGAPTPHVARLALMDPPLGITPSGSFALGLDDIIFDLSRTDTPPELLEKFGVGDEFQGLYVGRALLYFAEGLGGSAFDVEISDLLVSDQGEVSGEVELDLFGDEQALRVVPKLVAPGREIPVQWALPPGREKVFAGSAVVPRSGAVRVAITGGVPPYHVSVDLDGGPIWDRDEAQARFDRLADGAHRVAVEVRDSADPAGVRSGTIEISASFADSSEQASGARAARITSVSSPDAGGEPRVTLPSEVQVHLRLGADPNRPALVFDGHSPSSVTLNGAPLSPDASGAFPIRVADGDQVTASAVYRQPDAPFTDTRRLLFGLDEPRENFDPDGPLESLDAAQNGLTIPNSEAIGEFVAWVRTWAMDRATLDAFASNEAAENEHHDQLLSERRSNFVLALIHGERLGAVVDARAHGHFRADDATVPTGAGPEYRYVEVAATASAEVAPRTVDIHIAGPSDDPPSLPAARPLETPRVLRSLTMRFRLERNELVLFELLGEIDFETELEANLRKKAQTAPPVDHDDFSNAGAGDTDLGLHPPDGGDGIVDFRYVVTLDSPTDTLTIDFSLGAGSTDADGLLQMEPHEDDSRLLRLFKDAFGAQLMLAPLWAGDSDTLDPESPEAWVKFAAACPLPIALAAFDVLHTEKVTLYGGEAKARLRRGASDDFALLFDYGVEFTVDLEVGNLEIAVSKTPGHVRYKGMGFALTTGDDPELSVVFDPTRGYELDLGHASILTLPAPLGDILKIAAVRVVKHNPLTLELDLAMKVDLGVISVDSFKVKWPVWEEVEMPSILPSGVSVDLPGVLVGDGKLNIIGGSDESRVGTMGEASGFEGMLDLTLVPVKLRIAGSLGIQHVRDESGREATAVFAGLIVDFPSPLPIAGSGFGLYGLNGLFAMHYERNEDRSEGARNKIGGPALRWLANPAEGEAARLFNHEGVHVWTAAPDRWAFGVGGKFGSLDGPTLVTLLGTFLLEIPSRALVAAKASFVENGAKKDVKKEKNLASGGLLGVLDLDFAGGTATLGLVAHYEIAKLVEIHVPIELFFDFQEARNWHLYFGTFLEPVTAKVLGIVEGRAYFMVDGKWDGPSWPGWGGEQEDLHGFLVAMGSSASLTLGKESIGLYLRASYGMDLAVTLSPDHLVGRGYFDGQLHVFIIDLEVHADISIEAKPAYLKAHLCGRIKLLFFTLKGCVTLEIGSGTEIGDAPELVRNVYVQSHAPVLTSGQAGEGRRPIDSSLGPALALDGAGAPLEGQGSEPVVPIDSVIVVQFMGSPRVIRAGGLFPGTFSGLQTSPGTTGDDWIELGGRTSARYELTELVLEGVSLSPVGAPVPNFHTPPKATWRAPVRSSDGANVPIDLALMSRLPETAPFALERSRERHRDLMGRWGDVCQPPAPAAPALWTFLRKPLGPSDGGWTLRGTAQVDPPGTVRRAPVPTKLTVDEGIREQGADAVTAQWLRDEGSVLPAWIIGVGADAPALPSLTVLSFDERSPSTVPAPLEESGFRLEGINVVGGPLSSYRLVRAGEWTGLQTGVATTISLSRPSPIVELFLISTGGAARVNGVDEAGHELAELRTTPTGRPERLVLSGASIARVRIRGTGASPLLLSIRAVRQASDAGLTTSPPALPHPGQAPTTPRQARLLAEFRDREARRLAALAEERPPAEAVSPTLPLGRVTAPRRAAPGRLARSRALRLPRVLRSTQHTIAPSIDLVAGPSAYIRFLIAVPQKGTISPTLREIGTGSTPLTPPRPLSDFGAIAVVTLADLPRTWIDPDGSWWPQVAPVWDFLSGQDFAGARLLLATYRPSPAAVGVRLSWSAPALTAAQSEIPTLGSWTAATATLGVVEVLSAAETARERAAKDAGEADIETLADALGDHPSIFLAPNASYTLGVTYRSFLKTAEGEVERPARTQRFRFRTDGAAPARIDPWLLATNPQPDERDVFWKDRIALVFNEKEILSLYEAYGHRLKAVLHPADGVPVACALAPDEAELVPAVVGSPFADFLEGMILGGVLPCVGGGNAPSHARAELPLELKPLTAYTLELELEPPLPSSPDQPTTPLMRRRFRTGRFESPDALARDLSARRIRQRALRARLVDLPEEGPVTVATDEDLQAALIKAGEQPLEAATTFTVTLYWARPEPSARFQAHALLLDGPEALWRSAYEPTLEEVMPAPSDPADEGQAYDPDFRRAVPREIDALIVAEPAGENSVARYVRSPSGTRTVVLLRDGLAPGTKVTLALVRPESLLFGQAMTTTPFFTVTVNERAPWETDA